MKPVPILVYYWLDQGERAGFNCGVSWSPRVAPGPIQSGGRNQKPGGTRAPSPRLTLGTVTHVRKHRSPVTFLDAYIDFRFGTPADSRHDQFVSRAAEDTGYDRLLAL